MLASPTVVPTGADKGPVLLAGRFGQHRGERGLARPAARAADPVPGALGIEVHPGPRIDPVFVVFSHVPYRNHRGPVEPNAHCRFVYSSGDGTGNRRKPNTSR